MVWPKFNNFLSLKAAVPQGPVVDGWKGDDWFHYGAFRNMMLGYIHSQVSQGGAGVITPSNIFDKYEEFRRAGSTGDYIRAHGLDSLTWIALAMAHPAYDGYWQGQGLEKQLVTRPSSVPTLWTQGLWDQEDMWGANHAWLALKAAGHVANNWLVLGPWNHIQVNGVGRSLGPQIWHDDTALEYRRDILLPFLKQHLEDGPAVQLAPVTVYNTGEDRWEHFATWPTACERGCPSASKPLYLSTGFGLSFDQPAQSSGSDTYVSDPANPVPFLPRPVVDPFANLGAGSSKLSAASAGPG